jgi:hypothetical protein
MRLQVYEFRGESLSGMAGERLHAIRRSVCGSREVLVVRLRIIAGEGFALRRQRPQRWGDELGSLVRAVVLGTKQPQKKLPR